MQVHARDLVERRRREGDVVTELACSGVERESHGCAERNVRGRGRLRAASRDVEAYRVSGVLCPFGLSRRRTFRRSSWEGGHPSVTGRLLERVRDRDQRRFRKLPPEQLDTDRKPAHG